MVKSINKRTNLYVKQKVSVVGGNFLNNTCGAT